MTLEQRIHSAEADLFGTVGVEVDESFLELATPETSGTQRIPAGATATGRKPLCAPERESGSDSGFP